MLSLFENVSFSACFLKTLVNFIVFKTSTTFLLLLVFYILGCFNFGSFLSSSCFHPLISIITVLYPSIMQIQSFCCNFFYQPCLHFVVTLRAISCLSVWQALIHIYFRSIYFINPIFPI